MSSPPLHRLCKRCNKTFPTQKTWRRHRARCGRDSFSPSATFVEPECQFVELSSPHTPPVSLDPNDGDDASLNDLDDTFPNHEGDTFPDHEGDTFPDHEDDTLSNDWDDTPPDDWDDTLPNNLGGIFRKVTVDVRPIEDTTLYDDDDDDDDDDDEGPPYSASPVLPFVPDVSPGCQTPPSRGNQERTPSTPSQSQMDSGFRAALERIQGKGYPVRPVKKVLMLAPEFAPGLIVREEEPTAAYTTLHGRHLPSRGINIYEPFKDYFDFFIANWLKESFISRREGDKLISALLVSLSMYISRPE